MEQNQNLDNAPQMEETEIDSILICGPVVTPKSTSSATSPLSQSSKSPSATHSTSVSSPPIFISLDDNAVPTILDDPQFQFPLTDKKKTQEMERKEPPTKKPRIKVPVIIQVPCEPIPNSSSPINQISSSRSKQRSSIRWVDETQKISNPKIRKSKSKKLINSPPCSQGEYQIQPQPTSQVNISSPQPVLNSPSPPPFSQSAPLPTLPSIESFDVPPSFPPPSFPFLSSSLSNLQSLPKQSNSSLNLNFPLSHLPSIKPWVSSITSPLPQFQSQ